MSLIDKDDLPRREREPLPSKEQVEAVTDIPSLEAMQESIDKRIKHIEVDLEFEVGDEDWDERARGALAAHRICLGHVTRHLARMRKHAKPDKGTPEHISAKAQKREAEAAKQRAMAEASRVAKDAKQVALAQARLDLIDRTTFQGFFMRSAAKLLTPEMYESVMADAQLRHANACRNQITLPRSAPTETQAEHGPDKETHE